jgi:hypothetical protein
MSTLRAFTHRRSGARSLRKMAPHALAAVHSPARAPHQGCRSGFFCRHLHQTCIDIATYAGARLKPPVTSSAVSFCRRDEAPDVPNFTRPVATLVGYFLSASTAARRTTTVRPYFPAGRRVDIAIVETELATDLDGYGTPHPAYSWPGQRIASTAHDSPNPDAP